MQKRQNKINITALLSFHGYSLLMFWVFPSEWHSLALCDVCCIGPCKQVSSLLRELNSHLFKRTKADLVPLIQGYSQPEFLLRSQNFGFKFILIFSHMFTCLSFAKCYILKNAYLF